jgi:hypothetical protein
MDAAAVTLRTRAQIERVQRNIDEARSRTIAAQSAVNPARAQDDRGQTGKVRRPEDESGLD